jgi:hypothetical protein
MGRASNRKKDTTREDRMRRPPRPVRIVCAGHIGMTRPGHPWPDVTGQYLKSYDPEARDGEGEVTWTPDRGLAMTFPDVAAAHACWTQVPRSRPVRPYDGQPNRPLTAWSITFETASDMN